MRLYIEKAVCNDDITVDLWFNDKTHQHVDIGEFIRRHPHPQHNKYLNKSFFKKMKLKFGNIVWGNDMEFHLESLYTGKL